MMKMSLSVAAAAVLAMTAVTSGFAAELPTMKRPAFRYRQFRFRYWAPRM
jgi:hypothetical protein